MTELVGLYVAPPFRRRGIGTALVRHVLVEARNNKVACVRLAVAKDNDVAIATYLGALGGVAAGGAGVIRVPSSTRVPRRC